MSSVTQIKLALKTLLAQLRGVDQSDIDNYLPPVQTQSIALVIPPFGQETRIDILTSTGSRLVPQSQKVMQSHRIRCEFWVKIDTGNLGLTLARASDIPLEAIQLLVANQALGGKAHRVGSFGKGDTRWAITAQTIEQPIQVGGVPYIVVVVNVPIIEYAENA